ncbi:hypothetical protein BCR43DRAFT_338742 [Syncephalastrum racemosum]|uniref:Uncharacterized protein n=1 Tax=Syncephalastrum racemosum TaxID=13706 RepID=A0A1X2H8W4_SYNRA|nr:hypothetical protein BCR43DRAFT_338742 [Syncephalastrum racemosum]
MRQHVAVHVIVRSEDVPIDDEQADPVEEGEDVRSIHGLQAFKAYRCKAISKIERILAVDSNMSELLSGRVRQSLPREDQLRIRQNFVADNAKKLEFSIASSIRDIVAEYASGCLKPLNARFRLLHLATKHEGPARNVILTIESLIPAQKDLDREDLQESEIGASYVHPFIQSLCAIDEPDKVAKCANTIPTDEVGDYTSRPDYVVDMYKNYSKAFSTCFGEVKGDATNYKSTAFDFYRLAIFGKNQLDNHGLNKVLLFQSIGTDVTFYVIEQLATDMYAMIEMATIQLPRSHGRFKSIMETLMTCIPSPRSTAKSARRKRHWNHLQRSQLNMHSTKSRRSQKNVNYR